MIDLKLLRDDPDRARASQHARGEDPLLVDALLAADEARRAAVTAADQLRGAQKEVSASVRSASPEERPAVLEKAKALAAQVKELEAQQTETELALRAAHLAVPNVVLPRQTVTFTAWNFTAGERVSFWFTLPDGSVFGTANPLCCAAVVPVRPRARGIRPARRLACRRVASVRRSGLLPAIRRSPRARLP